MNVRAGPNPSPLCGKQSLCGIDYDEDNICCVFSDDGAAKLITIIRRDYLVSTWKDHGFSTLNDEVVEAREKQIIDINEKFYQYCDGNPDSTIFSGDLLPYFEEGGGLRGLALSIENGICACGGGLFLIAGWICKLTGNGTYLDMMRVVGLFSLPKSSIVYMDLAPGKFLGLTKYQPKSSHFTTKIMCIAENAEDEQQVMMFDINRENLTLMKVSLHNDFQNAKSVIANEEEWIECYIGPIAVVTDDEIIIPQVLSCQRQKEECGEIKLLDTQNCSYVPTFSEESFFREEW